MIPSSSLPPLALALALVLILAFVHAAPLPSPLGLRAVLLEERSSALRSCLSVSLCSSVPLFFLVSWLVAHTEC